MMSSVRCFQVVEFCDNSTNTFLAHDKTGPTDQNKICGNKSVWEVLRGHPDFSNFKVNRKRKTEKELEPEFEVSEIYQHSLLFFPILYQLCTCNISASTCI